MPWTTEEKTFIVEAYFRLKSIHAAQLQFKERFKCREFPVHSMIYRWVNKFRTHGTVHNLNCKDTNRQSHSGRPKSSRTPHNIAAVRDSVVRSPSKSVRRRSQELGINRESVRRILNADLHLYPVGYRLNTSLHLTTWRNEWSCASGFATRLTLCQTSLTMSGFRTRHIFCCQVTWPRRTISSGIAHPLSTSAKAITLGEVHCLGRHLQTWHHWTILVRGRQRAVCDNQHRAICPGAWQVLDSTWSTERSRQGPPVVPAGWCHPPHLKRIIGMATAAFPWPTDQPQVWPGVVAAFTGPEPPRFLSLGIP